MLSDRLQRGLKSEEEMRRLSSSDNLGEKTNIEGWRGGDNKEMM